MPPTAIEISPAGRLWRLDAIGSRPLLYVSLPSAVSYAQWSTVHAHDEIWILDVHGDVQRIIVVREPGAHHQATLGTWKGDPARTALSHSPRPTAPAENFSNAPLLK